MFFNILKIRLQGSLELEKASVNWMLSIDANTLPAEVKASGKRTYRTLTIDGDAFEFSEGFTELHTNSYTNIIAGNGFPLAENRKSIDLVHEIRNFGSFKKQKWHCRIKIF